MKGKLFFLFLISLFLGFVIVGGILAMIFPSILRISAPLVCKGEMTVSVRSFSLPGETSRFTVILCQDEAGGEKRDISFAAITVACLIYSVMFFFLFCANLLLKRLQGKDGQVQQPLFSPPTRVPQPVLPLTKNPPEEKDPAEQLTKLKAFREAELISEEEYQAKKAEIISKL